VVARVVCQVVPRADRLTFIWSEGAASFEPYHLTGAEQTAFDAVAAQARQALGGGADLAGLGHRLYRALFRLDAADGSDAQAIGRWLLDLNAKGQLESLEFVGDRPGRVPWNVLHDGAPAGGAQGFWGTRFNLAAGRRTNPLRFTAPLVTPTALLAADAALLDALSAPERAQLEGWRDERLIMATADEFAGQLRQRTPDVLVLLARVEDGALRLGGQRVTPAQLRAWIGEARDGNPNPPIFVGGAGSPDQAASWECWLAAAAADLDGLVTNIVPLTPAAATGLAVAAAERFVQNRRPIAAALADVRATQAEAGLALTAFCPPTLRVAETDDAETAPAPVRQPLPDYPYCPLRPYGPEDRPLFFGREEETLRVAALLDQESTAGVILHGTAAVGKTSLVQAGLWPYLEHECIGYRLLADRIPEEAPAAETDYAPLLLRPGSDLAGQIANALYLFCAQPLTYGAPTGQLVTVDLPAILALHLGSLGSAGSTAGSTAIQTPPPAAAPEQAAVGIAEPGHAPPPPQDTDNAPGPTDLWLYLREDSGRLGKLLDDITRRLPFELVVTIDDGDDLLTQARSSTEQERRAQALEMLMALAESPARCKVVLLLRTEYFGQLAGMLPVRAGRTLWKEYFLDELSTTGMADAVLGPTSRDEILYALEVPFAKYGFSYEEGLAQQLVNDVATEARARQCGALALLQVVCAMLYDRALLKRQDIIRASDLREIGGIRGALARYVARRIDLLTLPSAAREQLRRLVPRLTTRHTDGRITRDLVLARELKETWRASVPIEQAVNSAAEKAQLFAIDDLLVAGQSGLYVSLAHDSIAQAARLWEADARAPGSKRSGVIDTLWIMIPLAMLAAVLTWYLTRMHYAAVLDDYETKVKTGLTEFEENIQDQFRAMRPALYRGQLAYAETMLQTGNALGARQLLLGSPALSANPDMPPMRGFEWDYLWNRANSERYAFEGHRATVYAVSVSRDGQLAASASADGKVRLWRLGDGQAAGIIQPDKGPLYCVALAPDGKSVAAAGQDKIVRLWSLDAVKDAFVTITDEPKSLAGHESDVLALAFDKDGQTLASASADQSVILWDVKAGKPRATLKEHKSRVQALAFTPDGKAVASGGAEPAVVICDVESGKKLQTVATGLAGVAALAFAPDGKTLAVGGTQRLPGVETGVVRTWPLKADLTPGEPNKAIVQHGREVLAVAYLPGGTAFATAGRDSVIRLWDAASGTEVGQRAGHLGWVATLVATVNGTLVSGGYDRSVKVWDIGGTRSDRVVSAHKGWVLTLAFGSTKDGMVLASGGSDGTVKLWDPDSGAAVGELTGHTGGVTSIAFGVKLGVLAVGTWDDKAGGEIKIWELIRDEKSSTYKGKELQTLKGHKAGVTCLAYSLRGNRLASGSADHTVIVWDPDKGKLLQTLAGHQGEVRCLTFSGDGGLLFTGGTDKSVRLWDADKGQLIFGPEPLHTDSIEGIDFLMLPAGEKQDLPGVVTVGLDSLIRITTIEQDHFVARSSARAANHPMTCLVRRPSLLLTGGWDGTVRLWSIELRGGKSEGARLEFRERFTFTGQTGPVRTIALAPNLSVLAAGGRDGTIHLWRAEAAPGPRGPGAKTVK
jgi:WD40 repeat protein